MVAIQKIDYINNKAIPYYQLTYPVGSTYESITDCTSDSVVFYPLIATNTGCDVEINLNNRTATEKLRHSYNDNTNEIYVGNCTILPNSQVFAIYDNHNCSMKISKDKTQLINQISQLYENSRGEIISINECKPTASKISINAYIEKEYDNCGITTNPEFTRVTRTYRKFVNIPNGRRQLISNCISDPSSDSIALEKDYDNCVPRIDTLSTTPKVTMRAKLFYVKNGKEKVVQECATLTNEQHNLTKDYHSCTPNQEIVANKIFKYFKYIYIRNKITIPVSKNCQLESISSNIIIDQFSCKNPLDRNRVVFITGGQQPKIDTTNDINFYHNLNQGYSMIESKKIYRGP